MLLSYQGKLSMVTHSWYFHGLSIELAWSKEEAAPIRAASL